MHTKKPSSLITPSGLLRLLSQTVMGVAMGLVFALVLVVTNPSGIATLISHGGSQGIAVVVGTFALMFGIGATLTGLIFMMAEDD